MIALYRCTDPDCDALTTVQDWPATRYEPAESTWGDGCAECGAELREEPDMDDQDLLYQAAIDRAEAARDGTL